MAFCTGTPSLLLTYATGRRLRRPVATATSRPVSAQATTFTTLATSTAAVASAMSFTTCRIAAARWSRIAGSRARCLRSAARATCRRRRIALGFTPRSLSGSALTRHCIPLTAPAAAPTRATGQRDAVAIAQRAGAGGDDFVAVFQATEDLDDRTLFCSHLHR